MGYYIQLLEYGRVGINILYSWNRAAQLIGKLVPFPATVDTLPAELRKYSNLHLTGRYIHGQAMHNTESMDNDCIKSGKNVTIVLYIKKPLRNQSSS